MGRLHDAVWGWNATTAEREALYACEAHDMGPWRTMVRAVDVDAAPPVVFRWLCQIKVAPYSYDLVDNLGRRSPRTLTPGAEELAIGQRFGVAFRITDFAVDDHIVAVGRTGLLGPVSIAYHVHAQPGGTRLVGRIGLGTQTLRQRLAAHPLAVGDLVMMRKQLLTLKELAEGSTGAA